MTRRPSRARMAETEPVPQAKVIPQPRSHVVTYILLLSATLTKSTFVLSGKSALCSRLSPYLGMSFLSTSSNTIRCGTPIKTAVAQSSLSSAKMLFSMKLPSYFIGSLPASNEGSPISTVTLLTLPSSRLSSGRMTPASVSTVNLFFLTMPRS